MQSSLSPFLLLSMLHNVDVVMSWEAPLLRGAKISQSELEALANKAQLMSKHEEPGLVPVVNGCPACHKSYSEPCPLDWIFDADGECKAPSGYAGYCAQELNFAGWSVESKVNAEMSCSMCWPCEDVSVTNEAAAVE